MINIKKLNLKMITSKGNLRAIVDFAINESEFYSWRVIQEEGKKAWVSSPQESWDGEDGKKHYKPLVKLQPGLMKIVSERLLNEYNENL